MYKSVITQAIVQLRINFTQIQIQVWTKRPSMGIQNKRKRILNIDLSIEKRPSAATNYSSGYENAYSKNASSH